MQVAAELISWRRTSRGSYKPFLHHITKGRPIPVRPVKLPVPRRAPRILEPVQIVAILAACEHLRDRFLLSLLAETGMRVGQVLGLRHCDFVSRDREVHIVPRADNANGARAKLRLAGGTARFGGITQLWLREPVKRWSRLRLATGCAFATIDAGATGVHQVVPVPRRVSSPGR